MKPPGSWCWSTERTICLPSRITNPPCAKTSLTKFPFHRRVFPPLKPTRTCARTLEKNKGVAQSRTLESRPVAAEDVGFPFAAHAALLTRHHAGPKDETVGLITDLTPDQLPAAQWLKTNQQGWGIENGTHQRLDVSLNDDRCRVRNTNALWILGMLRRLVISLFMHGRAHQPKPQPQPLTDFQAAMGEDNLAKALAFLTHQQPKL